eukprot:3487280-Prymnesium_polylepis.1
MHVELGVRGAVGGVLQPHIEAEVFCGEQVVHPVSCHVGLVAVSSPEVRIAGDPRGSTRRQRRRR